MNYKIYKNTVILACLRVINPALSMVLIAFISKSKGPEFLGAYSLVITLSAVFTTLGVLGLNTLIIRETAAAKKHASAYLTSSLLLGLFSSIVMGGILLAAVPLFGYARELNTCLRLMSLYILFSTLVGFLESFFMAFEKVGLIFVEQVASNILRLIFSFVVILAGYGLVHFFLVILASGAFSLVLSLYLFHRHIARLSVKVDMGSLRFLLTNCPTFFFSTLFGVFFSMRIDIVMMSKLSDLIQVALYTAAFKLFDLTLILPQAYMSSFFPQLSQLFRVNSRLFRQMSRRILFQSLLYVVGTSVVMFVAASLLVHLLFGSRFEGSIAVFRIVLLALIPWSIAKVYGQILIASGRQRLDLYSTILVTVLNIALNFALIPMWGASGAAAAFAVSMGLFAVSQFGFAQKVLRSLRTVQAVQSVQTARTV